MATTFRNPFTPGPDEVFTPQSYLAQQLKFSIWHVQNPVVHEPSCTDGEHHEVLIYGMCCIQHLQECIESDLFDLAGCRAGVFVEPEGYQKWLFLAHQRLAELRNGQDLLAEWTTLLKEVGPDLRSWIWDHEEPYDVNLRPGFTLNSFVIACQKYDVKPDFKDIAIAFHFDETVVENCWANPA